MSELTASQNRWQISLPALFGDDILGFLAALGVLELCTNQLGDPKATVAWPEGPSGGAVLVTSVAGDVSELSSCLQRVAKALAGPDLLPGIANFPQNLPGAAGTDPVRVYSFEMGRAMANVVSTDGEPWLASVLALDEPIRSEKRQGSLSVTPLAARGPGTVMLARTLAGLAERAASDGTIESALTFWKREDTIAGYVDPLAKRNASHKASKKDLDNYGVPAAAWLAMMALPFFPALSSNTDIAIGPGWTRPPRQQAVFSWPMWRQQLDVTAVRVLLSHEAVASADARSSSPRLTALGVAAVFRSQRTVEGNNDGAMSRAERVWPAK
jgi:hypothetical protein